MGEFMDHHAGSDQCCQRQPAHQAKRNDAAAGGIIKQHKKEHEQKAHVQAEFRAHPFTRRN